MRGKLTLVAFALLSALALLGVSARVAGRAVPRHSAQAAQVAMAQPVAQVPTGGAMPLPPTVALAGSSLPWNEPGAGGAAEALRAGDCARALQRVGAAARRSGEGPSPPASARLVYGFYAHACEQVELAERELLAAEPVAGSEDGRLEDWRLLVLADSAMALAHPRIGSTALARLVTDHPDSPLAPRALLRLAEAAWSAGESSTAWGWIEEGRRRALDAETSASVEALAWRFAGESGDLDRRRAAARRLLWTAPIEASKLRVIDAFRSSDGGLDWSTVLSPEQLIERAERLLAAGLAPNAQGALDEVPVAARTPAWALLSAQARTAQHQGGEALAALAGVDSKVAATQRARLEWLRAEAKADLAVVRRGGDGPPAARRAELKREAQAHWRRVVELAGASGPASDPILTRAALRRLYQALDEEELFEPSLAILRRLQALDPEDETGLSILWLRGWQQFDGRNYTGAIGYWSELREIYPDSRTARIANYWTGRAYEALGQRERARAIYRRIVAADVTDFYARHARGRLPTGEAVAVEQPATVDWPRDARLDRAGLLTDAGLDALALAELDALGARVDRRASAALRAEVLARSGQRRPSVDSVIQAFPQLGWADQTAVPRAALSLYYPVDFADPLLESARRHGLDPHLVLGMVRQESAFDPRALSRSGARGLLQLMPATGREVAGKLGLPFTNERLWEPDYSLRLGTSYFSQLLGMFDGDVELALAGYNGGPNRIRRLWREAGHTETDRFIEGLYLAESRRYVKRILLLADSYRRLYPNLGDRELGALGS